MSNPKTDPVRAVKQAREWLEVQGYENRDFNDNPNLGIADVAAHCAEYAAHCAEGLLAALREHWLAGIDCNHQMETDHPRCACSRWAPPTKGFNSVGEAVEAWIQHLIEAATAREFKL